MEGHMAAISSVLCELLLALLAFLAAWGLHTHREHNARIEKLLEGLEQRALEHEARIVRVETGLEAAFRQFKKDNA